MKFIASEKRWDEDLTEEGFLAWFLTEINAGNYELVAGAVLTLEKPHGTIVARAFNELERAYPLRPEQPPEEKQTLPVSRLTALLIARMTPNLLAILDEVGVSLRENGFPHRALYYYENLAQHLEVCGDLLNLAFTYVRRGRCLSELDEWELDLPHYWKALRLFQHIYADQSLPESKRNAAALGLAEVQHQLAFKCHEEKDYEHSLLYNYRALSIRDRLNPLAWRPGSYMNVARTYMVQGDEGKALLNYLRTVNLELLASKTISNQRQRCTTYGNLGALARNLQEPPLELSFYERALSLGFRRENIVYAHAQLLIKLNRSEEAVQVLLELLRTQSKAHPLSSLHWILALIGAYGKLGRETEVARHQEQFLDRLIECNCLVSVTDESLKQRIKARINWSNSEEYHTLAVLRFAKGEVDAARTAVLTGLEKCSHSRDSDTRQKLLTLRSQLGSPVPVSNDGTAEANSSQVVIVTCRACSGQFPNASNGTVQDGSNSQPSDVAVQTRPEFERLCPECQKALDLEVLIRIPSGSASLPGGETKLVSSLLIDKYPVTNRLFRIYHKVMKLDWNPSNWQQALFRHPDQPMTCISLKDCEQFCAWRSRLTGRTYRLPSIAEWYRAALGDDGRTYPWGNEPPDYTRAAYSLVDDHDAFPAPVGLFAEGSSPFGVLDMGGNVWEWTSSVNDQNEPICLGGSCGSEAQYLNPRNLLHMALNKSSKDSREYRQVGFRCVGELQ